MDQSTKPLSLAGSVCLYPACGKKLIVFPAQIWSSAQAIHATKTLYQPHLDEGLSSYPVMCGGTIPITPLRLSWQKTMYICSEERLVANWLCLLVLLLSHWSIGKDPKWPCSALDLRHAVLGRLDPTAAQPDGLGTRRYHIPDMPQFMVP